MSHKLMDVIPEFPVTEKQFDDWWKGKEDNSPTFAVTPDGKGYLIAMRWCNCPLARCLQAHGFPNVRVVLRHWIPDYDNYPSVHIYLPEWAISKRVNFDNDFTKAGD